jgi:chitinase
MRTFATRYEVESLMDDEALEIVRMAHERLMLVTMNGELPYALDDSGDYINAAIENYHDLFRMYWDNDGDPTAFVAAVKKWLLTPTIEWGATDGEIRYSLFVQDYDDMAYDGG